MQLLKYCVFAAMIVCSCLSAAVADAEDYQIKVDVVQQGSVFQTQASFYLPLNICQAYRYITDYDAATEIPGVVASTTTRMDARKVRVERVLQERILFFPINLRTVLEVSEIPNQGTDFVQIRGEAKSYKGSWRLQADAKGTLFTYKAESEPDSIFPKAVVEYFFKNRLNSSFEAMAKAGAAKRQTPC